MTVQTYSPHRELAKVMVTVMGEEFFFFPLDWGAAREADQIEEYLKAEGARPIRYDLQVASVGNREGTYRTVRNRAEKVADDLINGRTRLIKPNGYITERIEPIDFQHKRDITPFEDWIRYTAYGLKGGIAFSETIRPFINGCRIVPSVIHKEMELEIPEWLNPDASTLIYPSYLTELPRVSSLNIRQHRVLV